MTDKFIKKPQFLAANLLILLSIGMVNGDFTFLQTIIGLMAWFMIWPMKELPTSYYGQLFIAASFGTALLLIFGVFLKLFGLGLGAGIGYFIFWGLAAVTVYFLVLNPKNIID